MGRGGWRYRAGRPGWHVKADECLRLDVRALARRGVLAGGTYTWHWSNSETGKEVGSIGLHVSTDAVRLVFAANGQHVTQEASIDRTPCSLGGSRPWFRCPSCNRRAAVLFNRGGLFRCRSCSGVVYTSQSEDRIGRLWRRQRKLEARLGENWRRPKGMHRTTRERILNGIFELEERRELLFDAMLGRLEARAGPLSAWF